ncbi:MAG: bacillithiol system redox-active protein YtxJ [Vicinamibacterales bacterium]
MLHAPVDSTLPLRPLTSASELDAGVDRSSATPVLFFKHSHTCGRSAMALSEVADFLVAPEGPVEAYLIDVREHRDVSNAIASRFGIRHESPQALLLHHGTVAWHGSHFRVTAEALKAALRAVAPAK